MVQQNYEDKWLPIFKKSIINHFVNMGKKAKAASTIEELQDIFHTKGLSNTNRLYFIKVFKPNEYMAAVLQFLADKGATPAKKLIELYSDIIVGFTDARLYEALHILYELNIIKREILKYVSRKPVSIWIAPFASQLQVTNAKDPYEPDRIAAEQRALKDAMRKETIKIEKTIKYEGKPKQKKLLSEPLRQNVKCNKHGVGNCRDCIYAMKEAQKEKQG